MIDDDHPSSGESPLDINDPDIFAEVVEIDSEDPFEQSLATDTPENE